MQGGGAVGAGDGMSRAGGRAERGFEGGDSRSGGQPVAPQHLGHSGDVVILDVLPAVGKKLCRSGSHFSLSTIMVRRRSSSSQSSFLLLAKRKPRGAGFAPPLGKADRKSTRLNSSH